MKIEVNSMRNETDVVNGREARAYRASGLRY